MPERINRAVFVAALVLENGESFLSNGVAPPINAIFTSFGGVPFFPAPLDRTARMNPLITMDVEVWQEFLLNTVDNQTMLFDTYSKVGLPRHPPGPTTGCHCRRSRRG